MNTTNGISRILGRGFSACLCCALATFLEGTGFTLGFEVLPSGEGSQLELSISNLEPGVSYYVETTDPREPDLTRWEACPNRVGWPSVADRFLHEFGLENQSRFFRIVPTEDPPVQRGRLIEAELIRRYSISEQRLILTNFGLYPAINPQDEISIYRLRYETVGVGDFSTVASGIMSVPSAGSDPLPMISYQHGTIVSRTGVPSMNREEEYNIALVCASVGYVGVAADYLGMGIGDGYHPYLHAKSEATAVIDCIYAAREQLANLEVTLNGKLFLTGYSQGGHATMAAHRDLEKFHPTSLPVTASAPSSGPYLISDTVLTGLAKGTYPEPALYAYLIHAYQNLYQFANGWDEIVRAPFDEQVPMLFDGSHTDVEANGAFPQNMRLFFQEAFFETMTQSPETHPFYQRLLENDVVNWKPVAPIRLYHTAADQIVPIRNAELALAAFQGMGVDHVQIVDVNPALGHGESGLPSFLSTLQWFATF